MYKNKRGKTLSNFKFIGIEKRPIILTNFKQLFVTHIAYNRESFNG